MRKLRRFARMGSFMLLSGACAIACSKDEASNAGDGGRRAASGGLGDPSGAAANGTGGSSGATPANGAGGSSGDGAGVGGTSAANGGTTPAAGRGTGGRAGASSEAGGGGAAANGGARAGSSGTSGGAGTLGAGGAMSSTAGSAGAGTGTGGKTAGSGGAVGAGTLKIMAIGDSITQATCWRALLWQTLSSKHAGQFDFVGTHQSDAGCSPSNYDQDNEAYGSSLLSEAVSGLFQNNRMCSPPAASGPCPKLNDFTTAFKTYEPDIALIHYGTNDVWNSIATSSIMVGFDELATSLRGANANVKIFVAQIIPMNVTDATCGGCSCSACTSNIAALNSALTTWALMHSTAESPIVVVDQNTGFDAVADTRDGVHPNDSGSRKMAAKWDAVLEPLF